ncbi:hypothetical protein V6N13_071748 [Hibiscus sabdariffa]
MLEQNDDEHNVIEDVGRKPSIDESYGPWMIVVTHLHRPKRNTMNPTSAIEKVEYMTYFHFGVLQEIEVVEGGSTDHHIQEDRENV